MAEEAILIKEILEWLDILRGMHQLDYTRIHVDGIRTSGGGRRKNPMKGFSDIEVVVRGHVGYIETKSKKGILSDEQQAFAESRMRHGAKYLLARKLDDVILFLQNEMKVGVHFAPHCQIKT